MLDPVLAVVFKAGSLTLQEFSRRVGNDPRTWLQLASLMKNGDVRFEGPASTQNVVSRLGEPSLETEQIAERLAEITQGPYAESIEISPTTRAWRRPA